MEKDQLLDYFVQEEQSRYNNYMVRKSLEEFEAIDRLRLKEQYRFLNGSNLLNSKKKETLQLSKTHRIDDIWGTRMRSIVDNQIYSIFCEAPTRGTMADFWYICYTQKVDQIYMLLPKCDKYWPGQDQQISFAQTKITIFCKKKVQVNPHLDKSQIIIKSIEGERILEHFHFKSWLDGCVPQGEEACAVFQELVKEAAKTIENKGLLLIHCRAGIGRTGTFGATIEATRLLQKIKTISLFEVAVQMRLYRLYCIQTFEQYYFIQKQTKALA